MNGDTMTTGVFGSPACTIVFELEAPPRIVWDCVNDAETSRLADWIEAHAEYVNLVAAAQELAARDRAA